MSKGSTASFQPSDLQLANAFEGLQILYQPIVLLSTGRIAGFEALVRSQHLRHDFITQNGFIPLAEATGLINSLGGWVLREACRQISVWQGQFPTYPPLFISVNLSSTQLTTPDLIEQIEQILQENQLDASSLQLEITESVLIQDTEAVTPMLQQLRNRGSRLCIDNFGTAYSFLSYLYRLPINTLKIAPAFISQIGVEPENWEIVQAIVMLAHNLSLNVTAAGVETAHQLVQLRRLGCKYGQGYFFSQLLDNKAVEALLEAATHW